MGLLTTIQQTIVDRLKADGYFSDIPVLNERIGDIQNEIERQLAALGICVIVLTPRARVDHADAPGPYFSQILAVVRVTENVLANQSATGTQKPAADVIEIVCANLHQYVAPGTSVCFTCQPDAINLAPDPTGNLSYDAEFLTHGGIKYTPQPINP